jgi:wobble nucleotide-excising tRNase
MINKIEIKNCASFDAENGVEINDLKEINFIYGANGSGKTTISNAIADILKYPQSNIDWKDNTEIKTFVYNRTFVDENFARSRNLKGVFTLGKAEKDTKDEIDTKKAEIDKLKTKIINNTEQIQKKNDEKEENEKQFETDCWAIFSKLKNDFKAAFQGCSRKNTFKEECKTQIDNSSDLLKFDKLKEKAERIYKGSTETKNDIVQIDFKNIEDIENHNIWETKIIGKKDVDIAAMIEKLDNSDWVKQGRIHFENNNAVCPFCQQPTPPNFENLLSEYFNETYLKQIEELEQQQSNYLSKTDDIILQISTLISLENKDIDNIRLEELKELLKSKIDNNNSRIKGKIKEPSSTIILDKLKDEQDLINTLVQKANDEIKLHNDTVKNITREKSKLTNEVWRYVVEQIRTNYQTYKTKNTTLTKTIKGLEKSKKDNTDRKDSLIKEITELEKQNTGIEHTKTGINNLLDKFGFTNFKLVEATEEKGSYQIVRPNGESVKRTLSEGEKTFITFLYFYHWLKGGFNQELITVDRIAVFDDPISSLDSDVLFIVSHLIRKLINEVRNKPGNIKQIIILTHNVYFHKEVTYNKGKGVERLRDETFWIIRKENDISKVKLYEKNPVQTSYELLWREIKENPSSITIENTLRRIIENYFKMFGGISLDDILKELDDEDKIIANSLLSWSHAGSHGVNDDLYVTTGSEKHLKVFKNIFEKTKHIEHYKMMMGENEINS